MGRAIWPGIWPVSGLGGSLAGREVSVRSSAVIGSGPRIAIVSHVHGSLPALEAVIEDLARHAPDLVLHGGDLALMGPQPVEVADRIRELGWAGVVGNTDELLWRPELRELQMADAPKLRALIELLFDEYRPHTAASTSARRDQRGAPTDLRRVRP